MLAASMPAKRAGHTCDPESALKAEKTLHKQVSISYKRVCVMLSLVLAEISC